MSGGADRTGVDESRWGVPLRYACERNRLTPALAGPFVPSHLDTEGEAFLASVLKRGPGVWRLRAHRVARLFLSDFDANALLGIYPVFLLSTPQALLLLNAAQSRRWSEERWLDVGAGSGDLTTRLAPLVGSMDCTETSRFMARRLRQRGFKCWLGEVAEGEAGDPLTPASSYGAISLFNVIDRARRPRALLRASVAHLPVGGTLVVSMPLPYEPFFYSGAVSHDPQERLQVDAEDWEAAVEQLWHRELAPLGLAIGALSRVPYLSGGDAKYPAYVLDSAVFVCRKL